MNTALPPLTIQTFLHPFNHVYSDQREHGDQGPSRHVRLSRVTPAGGGLIARNETGTRCAVTGKESLRILRVSPPSEGNKTDHKSATGKGGYRIDASRNFWDASGLKMDSASTDIAWGYGSFSNKILTSARNGELIMWDIHKSGTTKCERRTRETNRCINRMATSVHAPSYCITGAVDGQLRVWDLKDTTKSILRITHPSQNSIRSLAFSPIPWNPVQAVVGHDNGTIYRWDLRMGQRGQLDKVPVAHNGPVTSLDWYSPSSSIVGSTGVTAPLEATGMGSGWLASGGLDRCVKVWDLTGDNVHIPHKPTYTLRSAYPIRRIAWRPGYECEIAIVSNNDYSTHTLDAPGSSLSGGLTPGLDAMKVVDPIKDKASSSGDAIEIWDVRRGWIAKWRVSGSASDGGATDITFNGEHVLWAQHASGTFSQLDLRNVTKPIDTIPRAAATWDVTGSMAFVVDDVNPHEVPYDDVMPELRTVSDARKLPEKALGDLPVRLTTQAVGIYAHDFTNSDSETFKTLAKRYIYEGRERQEICAYNAGVASLAGHETAAEAWLLLGASLAQFVPPPLQPATIKLKTKKIPSPLLPSRPFPQQTSAVNGYTFPSSTSMGTSPDKGSFVTRSSAGQRSASVSVSRMTSYGASASASSHSRLTPTSSTTSSPRNLPVPLPLLTPMHGSFLGRRDSVDATAPGSAISSLMLRRASLPVPPLQSSSPSERSMRHVGEGVLEDSDSDDSEFGGDGEDEEGDETAGVNSSDEEGPAVVPVLSPGVSVPRPFPTPSPLSRLAGRQSSTSDDTEKEDGRSRESDADDSDDDDYNSYARLRAFHDGDGSSPSPQSSDTGFPGGENAARTRRPRSSSNALNTVHPRRWTSAHNKRRSRSSTIASLAVPRALTHHDSHSSIRTVTAAGGETTSMRSVGGKEDRENKAETGSITRHQASAVASVRPKSSTMSELVLNAAAAKALSAASKATELAGQVSPERAQMTERRIESIRIEDRRFKETTLAALKDALEEFADEGDVQTCAMLSLVAPKELEISLSRSTRFLDSYLELLNRMQLYTCAAYLRKYSEAESIRKPTLIGTTIYSSCGKCRKPLLRPAGGIKGTVASKGGYSYCLSCKKSRAICSICRLPVRALLFQCPVCNHGGHQDTG
ncbi:hypothetical protein HYPSUDRAFT_216934 [Hypholoma sublateritium FD-334 SS-4]|uniref:Uncharacterized protein n=1 Tax=Hypholoma sublateritium (strain FD-334 SS-4) TaxID=945553 RepID=A0A0D2L1G2_HYPSF|nr:hypothetical protein HYPSUDRAFT_216934 [Hypholoma sublateritium FD-334 SS-4]